MLVIITIKHVIQPKAVCYAKWKSLSAIVWKSICCASHCLLGFSALAKGCCALYKGNFTTIYIKMIDFANLSAGRILLLFILYIQVTNFTLYTLMQNSVLHVLYTWKERKRKRRSQSSFNLDFEIVWYMHFFLKPSWESRETTIKAILISSPISACKPSLPFRSFSPYMPGSPKFNQHLEGC